MNFKTDYFFCSPRLLKNVDEIDELTKCLKNICWAEEFVLEVNGHEIKHQRAYNKAFEIEFLKSNWELQPLLYDNPKLIGDFRKNDVFVEVKLADGSIAQVLQKDNPLIFKLGLLPKASNVNVGADEWQEISNNGYKTRYSSWYKLDSVPWLSLPKFREYYKIPKVCLMQTSRIESIQQKLLRNKAKKF